MARLWVLAELCVPNISFDITWGESGRQLRDIYVTFCQSLLFFRFSFLVMFLRLTFSVIKGGG
ncbi:hypothetical protein BDR06DRAFT_958880 [Suillus hirtellus]|nr:hypothetical protein BDR06DRAFT_958880 [Suillus hirtellus]